MTITPKNKKINYFHKRKQQKNLKKKSSKADFFIFNSASFKQFVFEKKMFGK
jgi:hypothetical protein